MLRAFMIVVMSILALAVFVPVLWAARQGDQVAIAFSALIFIAIVANVYIARHTVRKGED